MKPTLLLAACLAAFSYTANASSVTLYGNLDTGFAYVHDKTTTNQVPNGGHFSETRNSFVMSNGVISDNFIGLKGKEDLGNGMQVGFVLESQFNLSNGDFQRHLEEIGEDGKPVFGTLLFEREARLFVKGAYGALSIGRMDALTSSTGSFNIISRTGDAFEGYGLPFDTRKKLDNAITYQSPEVAGFTGYAQYSLDVGNEQNDKFKDNLRYYALGGAFHHENFNLAGAFEQYRMPNEYQGKNLYAIHTAANMKLGDFTLYGTAAYTKNDGGASVMIDSVGIVGVNAQNNSNSRHFSLGTKYEFGSNEVMVGAQFVNGKYDDVKVNCQGAAARFVHHLSKRTGLYAGTMYSHSKVKNEILKTNTFSVYAGLKHSF